MTAMRWNSLVLHGLRVVAALKLEPPALVLIVARAVLHGLRVVAALKQEPIPGVAVGVADVLHGLRVVAALKHRCPAGRVRPARRRSPRPSGRGRIEAMSPAGDDARLRVRGSPRPSGRGRIEALMAARKNTTSDRHVLHGLRVVAALKRSWPPDRYSRPAIVLHGLRVVAALKHRPVAERRRPEAGSPRPSGRGRIEAPTARTTGSSSSMFSTAFGSWPH